MTTPCSSSTARDSSAAYGTASLPRSETLPFPRLRFCATCVEAQCGLLEVADEQLGYSPCVPVEARADAIAHRDAQRGRAIAAGLQRVLGVDDVEAFKKLDADVLGIFASREKYITPQDVAKFEANMKAAGKKLIVKNYDAEHGFANPSNQIFNKEATEDAYKHTVAFFRERLK